MRKHCLTLIIYTLLNSAFGATGDSLNYLTPNDTVLLQVQDNGKKLFEHKLEKGQTLYSLARFYGLKFPSLLYFNPGLVPEGQFTTGQAIRIPIPDSAIIVYPEYNFERKNYAPVCYAVKQGETVYRISRVYFNMTESQLLKNNNLTSTNLYTGQVLQIGWMRTDGIPDSLQWANEDPRSGKLIALKEKFENGASSHVVISHKGAAYWHRERKGETELFALHRYAPVGSVIQISNPMKNKVIYARVVRPIPDRLYGDEIIVVLSTSAAKFLEAKDPKFFVEVKYLK